MAHDLIADQIGLVGQDGNVDFLRLQAGEKLDASAALQLDLDLGIGLREAAEHVGQQIGRV